jgi:protoporphyrin/coproporphyrin ferrochelatase
LSIAVILMAYGSPARAEDVRAYLADIRGPSAVSDELVDELSERYRRIGGSPLTEISERQRDALARELDMPIYLGMKHWRPWISDAVEQALRDGAEHLVALVLAPHFSRMSIGGYRTRVERALAGRAELTFIESWYDHEPFLDVVSERVRGTNAHVVFTAHSLPERVVEKGDPYRDQLLETARLVAERARVERWSFAFQSASETGTPWLGPDILDELADLRARGIRDVLVAPIGFVADHLEILWDLDVEARARAAELGLRLERMPSLNDDPAFIRGLAELVRQVASAPSRIATR